MFLYNILANVSVCYDEIHTLFHLLQYITLSLSKLNKMTITTSIVKLEWIGGQKSREKTILFFNIIYRYIDIDILIILSNHRSNFDIVSKS